MKSADDHFLLPAEPFPPVTTDSESDSDPDAAYSRKVTNSVNQKGQLGRYSLRVHVREGKHLAAMDRGGTSDPFVVIKLVPDARRALTELAINSLPQSIRGEDAERLRHQLETCPGENVSPQFETLLGDRIPKHIVARAKQQTGTKVRLGCISVSIPPPVGLLSLALSAAF